MMTNGSRIDGLWEPLFISVRTLASSPQSVKKRLEQAYIGSFAALMSEEFPEDLRADFEALKNRLNKWPQTGERGSVEYITQAMTEEEASEVAMQFVSLFSAVARRYPERD